MLTEYVDSLLWRRHVTLVESCRGRGRGPRSSGVKPIGWVHKFRHNYCETKRHWLCTHCVPMFLARTTWKCRCTTSKRFLYTPKYFLYTSIVRLAACVVFEKIDGKGKSLALHENRYFKRHSTRWGIILWPNTTLECCSPLISRQTITEHHRLGVTNLGTALPAFVLQTRKDREGFTIPPVKTLILADDWSSYL